MPLSKRLTDTYLTHNNYMDTRKALRLQLRQARNALSQAQQMSSATQVATHLCAMSLIKKATHIATFVPNDGEVSLRPFMQAMWQQAEGSIKPALTLPVLHPVVKGHLLMLKYHPNTTMVNNKFGIEEPELACHNIVPLNQHQVILMPLVGFDNQGNRLGMGGGFYDRTLASVCKHNNRPTLIGIAHDCQHVAALPAQDWDVPLDAIVTPSGIYEFH